MGTPFIIIIFAVIVVCIAIAIIMASMMRTNSGLGVEEAEMAEASSAPVDNPGLASSTGSLPVFLPLPHQTQALSEIYYYDERIPGSQPSAPLAPLTSPPPAQPAPLEASVPPMQPPTGPLPGYSDQ